MLKTLNMKITGMAIPMVTIRGMIIPPVHSHRTGYNRKREHWYKRYNRFFLQCIRPVSCIRKML
jgi:hypothetical protein